MGKIEKLTIKILSGGSDTNIEFKDLLKLLLHLGFNFYGRMGLKKLLIFKQTAQKLSLIR